MLMRPKLKRVNQESAICMFLCSWREGRGIAKNRSNEKDLQLTITLHVRRKLRQRIATLFRAHRAFLTIWQIRNRNRKSTQKKKQNHNYDGFENVKTLLKSQQFFVSFVLFARVGFMLAGVSEMMPLQCLIEVSIVANFANEFEFCTSD